MVTDHSYALVALNFKVAISDLVLSSTISGVPGWDIATVLAS